MKTDLATSLITAILCAIVGYIICGFFLPATESVSFKILSGDANYSITDPDPEIFNFRAINPTVEVYVGDCENYNDQGECLDDVESVSTDEVELPEDAQPQEGE